VVGKIDNDAPVLYPANLSISMEIVSILFMVENYGRIVHPLTISLAKGRKADCLGLGFMITLFIDE
jgi:hypothetical protein